MTEKTILIVGGAGFIGSYVNKLLCESGYQTVVFDNLSRGNKQTVLKGKFIEGDICAPQAINFLFQNFKFDAVMHFASFIDVGESVANPGKYYSNNVIGSLNLANMMILNGINKLIFSSTAAIFGYPMTQYINESHPCLPINPYGRSKLMVEQFLRDFDKAYGLKSCCLRYFNAAGGDPSKEIKNFQKKETNLIPIILRNIKNGSPTPIFGTDYPTPDGTCIRDYVHIHDLATAHITAMEKLLNNSPSTCYNLGNGQGFSVKAVIAAVEKVTGKTVSTVDAPRRPGDPPILVAESNKAHQELGWQPLYPNLETIVEHAWNIMV